MLLLSGKYSGPSWKTSHDRRFGVPFNGTVTPFRQWSNISLFLRKTYRDYINLVLKVLPSIFLGCFLYSGSVNLERRHFDRRH